jgi:hypothetical protein
MSRVNTRIPGPTEPPLSPRVRNSMVGCLTAMVGFFGGGMIAVLVGVVVDLVRRCKPPEGLPVCGNWAIYAGVGGLVGAIILPTVAIIRLRRSDATARTSAQQE